MRAWLCVLALAGCDRVFGIGDPYEDAAGSTSGSDAAIDTVGTLDGTGPPTPAVLAHFSFDTDYTNSVNRTAAVCLGTGCMLDTVGGHSGGQVYLDGSSCLSFGLAATPVTYTIALWVKAQNIRQTTLLARPEISGSASQTWKISGNSTVIEYDTWDGTNTDALLSGPGLSASYEQVVVTFDGSYKHLFIDGVHETMGAATPVATADGTVFLGCESAATNDKLDGYLDEIYIYDGALTAAQVTALYNL